MLVRPYQRPVSLLDRDDHRLSGHRRIRAAAARRCALCRCGGRGQAPWPRRAGDLRARYPCIARRTHCCCARPHGYCRTAGLPQGACPLARDGDRYLSHRRACQCDHGLRDQPPAPGFGGGHALQSARYDAPVAVRVACDELEPLRPVNNLILIDVSNTFAHAKLQATLGEGEQSTGHRRSGSGPINRLCPA